MKDVISVDTILAGVFLEGAEVPKTDNPGKDLDVYMERSEYHIPIAQAKLYSLLISKLPEKSEVKYKKWIDGMSDKPSSYKNNAVEYATVQGRNSAIDDMKAVLDEMFVVIKELQTL